MIMSVSVSCTYIIGELHRKEYYRNITYYYYYYCNIVHTGLDWTVVVGVTSLPRINTGRAASPPAEASRDGLIGSRPVLRWSLEST